MATRILVTQRQLEVLLAMGQYGCTKHVVDALGLSRHTVRAHLAVLRERSGCCTGGWGIGRTRRRC
jgi:hypothetical protein